MKKQSIEEIVINGPNQETLDRETQDLPDDVKEERNKGGRPVIEMDLKQVELFGRFRATYETMAAWFDVNKDTINERMNEEDSPFSVHYKKGLADLQMKLSEAQIETALVDKNPTMQIWLGKQHLGQKDKQEIDTTNKVEIIGVVEGWEDDE